MTGDSQLKPYTSWADFVQHLKHPESLINFIAAYGTHPSITGADDARGQARSGDRARAGRRRARRPTGSTSSTAPAPGPAAPTA